MAPRAAGPARDAEHTARHRGDLWLALLLAALAMWVGLFTPGAPTGATPLLGALALAGGGYAAGRALSRTVPLRTVLLLVLAAGGVGANLLLPGAGTGTATAAPLGYGNANGALALLGTAAALCAALSVPGRARRLGLVAAAGLGTGVAVLTLSQAATLLAGLLTCLALLLAWRPSRGRALPPLSALAVVATAAMTGLLGLQGAQPRELQRLISPIRPLLWGQALQLIETAPVLGHGAGGFARLAPVAADADLRWAHNLWLQHAAETGLVGLVLLLAVTLFAVVRVRAEGWEDGGVPAMGAATTAALLVHGSIDYVFHFPVITAGTALLAGLTLAPRRVD